VTSGFGAKDSQHAYHNGVDLSGLPGTPVYAVGAGLVVASGPANGYGNWIVIFNGVDTAGNFVYTTYGHVAPDDLPEINSFVRSGSRIGSIGPTLGSSRGEHSTGPHLHWQVNIGGYGKGSGSPVNPYKGTPVNAPIGPRNFNGRF